MQEYSWPGNIRELENCIRYLTCLQTGELIQPEELPLLKRLYHVGTSEKNDVQSLEQGLTVLERPLKTVKQELVGDFERRYIENALSRSGGNVSQAARDSGKRRRVFFELMRKYDIDPVVYRLSTQGADSDESSAEPSGDRTQSFTQ